MIIIDKLCYRSKLRYVSAAEKLLYAVSSLMICVLTRSYAAALIVFIANGILTVGKGKIPLSCYVRLLMLIYRFVFILLHTASAIMTAQEARLGNRDYRTQLRAFGKMLTALFFISLRKANALYDAMEARGYDGTINVLERNTPAKKKEMILLAVFELVLIIVAAAERMI